MNFLNPEAHFSLRARNHVLSLICKQYFQNTLHHPFVLNFLHQASQLWNLLSCWPLLEWYQNGLFLRLFYQFWLWSLGFLLVVLRPMRLQDFFIHVRNQNLISFSFHFAVLLPYHFLFVAVILAMVFLLWWVLTLGLLGDDRFFLQFEANFFVDLWEIFLNQVPEMPLQDQGLLVQIRLDMVVKFAIIPAKLDVVQGILNDFIFCFVVVPSDLVEVNGLLDYLLVVSQSQCCILSSHTFVRDWLPEGNGLLWFQ